MTVILRSRSSGYLRIGKLDLQCDFLLNFLNDLYPEHFPTANSHEKDASLCESPITSSEWAKARLTDAVNPAELKDRLLE
jgi:hypothetical protein